MTEVAADVIVVGGHCRQVSVEHRLGQAHDLKRGKAGAHGSPILGGLLRVGIDQEHPPSLAGEHCGEVERNRRLACATLLINDRYDHPSAFLCFCFSRYTECDSSQQIEKALSRSG